MCVGSSTQPRLLLLQTSISHSRLFIDATSSLLVVVWTLLDPPQEAENAVLSLSVPYSNQGGTRVFSAVTIS